MFSANQLTQEKTVKVYFKTFLFEKCGKLESTALSTIHYTLYYALLYTATMRQLLFICPQKQSPTVI